MPSIDLIYNGQLLGSNPTIEGADATFTPAVKSSVHMGWYSVNYDGTGAGLMKNGDVYSGKPLKPGTYNLRFMGQGGFPKFEEQITYRQVVPLARWNGTISDNGSVSANIADMKSLGFDTIRVWLSWNAATGALANPANVDTLNNYATNGVNVIAQLTPQTNQTSVAYPAAAIVDLIARLDKRVVVAIINEANIEAYWPQAKWREAFAMASRISSDFQTAGFKTASPSFTYQTASSIVSWWTDAKANGWTNFDYIDGHSYPVIQPWAGGVEAAIANHEAIVKTYRGIADSLGKKTMMSEWGMYGDKTQFAATWPKLDAIVKKYTDASAYFIMRETAAHSKYGLHLIDLAGKRTAIGDAVAIAQGVTDQ